MQVKEVVIDVIKQTLYFCPNCKTGHMLKEGQEKCDICGVKLDWKKHD